eukprot:COSAG01_NODE_1306_length_10805_cov_29.835700_8_plen_170_part_00
MLDSVDDHVVVPTTSLGRPQRAAAVAAEVASAAGTAKPDMVAKRAAALQARQATAAKVSDEPTGREGGGGGGAALQTQGIAGRRLDGPHSHRTHVVVSFCCCWRLLLLVSSSSSSSSLTMLCCRCALTAVGQSTRAVRPSGGSCYAWPLCGQGGCCDCGRARARTYMFD